MANNNKHERNIPWLWIGLVVGLVALTVAWFFLPVGEWLKSFNGWVQGLGVWGYVIFAAVYIIATVLLAPGSPLTIAAGLAFSGFGFPLVVVAATIGAALAFLVARYLARSRVERMTERKPKFKAIDQAVTADGWKVVMLLRLSPLVPFNLQNYVFGVTDIKFWHYVAATFVGIMPGTALFVYLGAIGAAAGSGGSQGGLLKWAFFAIGLIATIVVTVLITRKAKARLDKIGLEENAANGGK
ncbi:MAG: TVP38/TMEM64 family protein [Gammaproteobacteria bacterium]|nr:TVP38/TMEM64 family protein [Gammaproteobacteria bacterium]